MFLKLGLRLTDTNAPRAGVSNIDGVIYIGNQPLAVWINGSAYLLKVM